MRICIVMSTKFPPVEGIGNHVYHTSLKLLERGHKVTLITRGEVRDKQESIDGIRLFRVRFIPIYPFHVHFHGIFVNRLIRKLEPELDLIHLHSPLVPAVNTRLPIVTTVHTPMKIDTRNIEIVNALALAIKLQAPVSYMIERRIIARSSLINTVAKSVAEELREYGLNPLEIPVLGTGVDTNQFTPPDNEVTHQPYILNVGRLAYRKGLFDLIQAAEIVCQSRPQIRFTIVGSGQIEKQLKAEVSRRGMADKFTFTGYVERHDLIKLYKHATIYVQPSHYEGLPVTLLEAMSCARPVIATAVSGMLDVVKDGENGLLIPPRSPKDTAKAIIRLIDDKTLRAQLARAARKTIKERYTWDAVTERLIASFEKVLL